MESWRKALEDIVWLTQLGLSVLLPPVMCLWLASWLVGSRGAPAWVYVPLLVLGLGAGAQNFWKFSQMLLKRAGKKPEKKPPVRFSRHQ